MFSVQCVGVVWCNLVSMVVIVDILYFSVEKGRKSKLRARDGRIRTRLLSGSQDIRDRSNYGMVERCINKFEVKLHCYNVFSVRFIK